MNKKIMIILAACLLAGCVKEVNDNKVIDAIKETTECATESSNSVNSKTQEPSHEENTMATLQQPTQKELSTNETDSMSQPEIQSFEGTSEQQAIMEFIQKWSYRIYVADFDFDGTPELCCDEGNTMADIYVIYDYDEESGGMYSRGMLNGDIVGRYDKDQVLYGFEDLETGNVYYRNFEVLHAKGSPYRDIWEYWYGERNGEWCIEEVGQRDEVVRDDWEGIAQNLEQRKSQWNMEEYKGKIVVEVITDEEVETGAFIERVLLWGMTEPRITLLVGGEEQNLPWNTYQYTVNEPSQLEELDKLCNLRRLVLDAGDDVLDCAKIPNMSRLYCLELRGSKESYVNMEALAQMENLKELYLYHMKPEQGLLETIEKLQSLQVFGFNGEDMTEDDIKELQTLNEMKNLKRVILYNDNRDIQLGIQRLLENVWVTGRPLFLN